MKFGSANISAIKFGSSTVSAVYLGATQVWSAGPQPRTLYYTPDITNDWGNLNNWWLDESFQTPTDSLPTSIDSVVVMLGPVMENTLGAAPVVANLTVNDTNILIPITVTGVATFTGAATNYGTVYGNAAFYGESQNLYEVFETTTFNDSAVNGGQLFGDAVFNGSSVNAGFVNAHATYNDNSSYACGANSLSLTYNSSAPQPVYGCTDQSANNYDDTATCDDGSCCYPDAYSEPGVCDSCGIMAYNSYDSCGNFTGTFLAPANSTECDYLC